MKSCQITASIMSQLLKEKGQLLTILNWETQQSNNSSFEYYF